MPANTTVPLGANPLELNVLETCFGEPLNVLFLLGEEHPYISKEAREPEAWVDRADETRFTTDLENPVRFPYSPLRVRPVLNAVMIITHNSQHTRNLTIYKEANQWEMIIIPSSRNVSIGIIGGKREILGISLNDLAFLQRLLLFCLGQLMWRLVQNSDILSFHSLDDAQSSETSTAADIDHTHIGMAEIGGLESVVPHILGPMAGIDDMVVYDG